MQTRGCSLVRKVTGYRPAVETVDLEEVIDPAQFPENELKLWKTHLHALEQHVQQHYPGRVVLMRTRGQPLFSSLEDDFCWGKLVGGGIEVCRISGSHENIFMGKISTIPECIYAAGANSCSAPFNSQAR